MYSLLLEYRCTCHHLLFKGIISPGSRLQIKCKGCGKIVSLNGQDAAHNLDDYFVLLLSNRGQILDASLSAGKILSYPVDKLRSMSIFDLAPLANPNNYQQMWQTLQAFPQQVFLADSQFKDQQGNSVYLRAKFRRHTLDNKPCVIVFYEVVNRQLDPKQGIFNSPNFLIFDLVAELSTEGVILYVSPEFIKKIGVETNVDILGKKISSLLDIKFSKNLDQDFKLMAEIQQTVVIYGVNFLDQEEKFDLLFTPIYYPDNRIKGFKLIAKSHTFHFKNLNQ